MKLMDASRVRGEFAAVLDVVRDTGEPVVVVRYGRPMAALVPLSRLTPRELRALNQASRSPAHERPGEARSRRPR
jgi:prevent-host-death family protein